VAVLVQVGWACMPGLCRPWKHGRGQMQALTSACVCAQDQAWRALGCHHRCCRAQTRRRGANDRQPRPSGGALLLSRRSTGGRATRRSASWWRTTRCLGWRRISSSTNCSEALSHSWNAATCPVSSCVIYSVSDRTAWRLVRTRHSVSDRRHGWAA